jgi:tetratricopeptide (TPR) repeat protein
MNKLDPKVRISTQSHSSLRITQSPIPPYKMSDDIPKVTMDPRWKAARTMVESGNSKGAVDMFATLVEETIARHSDTSLEAAACFYEYGNALLRAAVSANAIRDEAADQHASANATDTTKQQDPIPQDKKRQANEDHEDSKDNDVSTDNNGNKDNKDHDDTHETTSDKPSSDEKHDTEKHELNAGDVDGDFRLALEMMENAYSIFEEKASIQPKNEWIQYQLPRVLQGLGDVLRELGRMADAADAYSRALPYREEFVQKYKENDLTVEHLKNRRLLVEANILVAEGLLGCAHGKHVVTTETKDMLVTADERVDYARGYYEKAREELQETVFLMGRIAATGRTDELAVEKENVCFAATLLMGVGETLVTFDEELEESSQPAPKKLKLT